MVKAIEFFNETKKNNEYFGKISKLSNLIDQMKEGSKSRMQLDECFSESREDVYKQWVLDTNKIWSVEDYIKMVVWYDDSITTEDRIKDVNECIDMWLDEIYKNITLQVPNFQYDELCFNITEEDWELVNKLYYKEDNRLYSVDDRYDDEETKEYLKDFTDEEINHANDLYLDNQLIDDYIGCDYSYDDLWEDYCLFYDYSNEYPDIDELIKNVDYLSVYND